MWRSFETNQEAILVEWRGQKLERIEEKKRDYKKMERTSIFHSLDESWCKKEQRNRGVVQKAGSRKTFSFYFLKKTQICFIFLLISLSWHTGVREAAGECPEVWVKGQSGSPLSFPLYSICQNSC